MSSFHGFPEMQIIVNDEILAKIKGAELICEGIGPFWTGISLNFERITVRKNIPKEFEIKCKQDSYALHLYRCRFNSEERDKPLRIIAGPREDGQWGSFTQPAEFRIGNK